MLSGMGVMKEEDFVLVFGNGVMVCESEGIRLGIGGMVSGSEEMKEADFVSASCRLASGLSNFKK